MDTKNKTQQYVTGVRLHNLYDAEQLLTEWSRILSLNKRFMHMVGLLAVAMLLALLNSITWSGRGFSYMKNI